MPQTSRMQLALYAVALCAIAWLGARYLSQGGGGGPAPPAAVAGADDAASGDVAVEREGGGRVVVHVAGAVRDPGVYRLRDGERVEDAVEAAGGPTGRADLDGLNLASKVQDGRQVVVPRRGVAGAAAAAGIGTAAPGAPDAPIDLNTATPEQLDTLDGVGPATVRKIVEYRETHGGFGSVEELGQVSGIGEKRMAALRERVRV